MVKIFDDKSTWGGKVNFVDHNNVLVGYDMCDQCCEFFGWFINNKECVDHEGENMEIDLTDFQFDTSYFERIDFPEQYEAGGIARFKMVNGGETAYLHLFNEHNGYYSHGFDMKINDEIKQSGSL